MKNLAHIWGNEVEEMREGHIKSSTEKRELKKMKDIKPIVSNKRRTQK